MNKRNILFIIAWTMIGMLFTATLSMYLFAPEYIDFNRGLLVGTVLLLSILVFLDRKRIKTFLDTSFAKNMLSNSITIFLVLCIIALINYLGYKNSVHYDFTETKIHTLSEQSLNVLKNFKSPIKITLFSKRQEWQKYLNLLKQFEQANKNISVSAVDVETNPALAKLNNVREDGTIIVEYQGRRVQDKADSELKVTNLLLKLVRTKKLSILYTKGHGEIDFNDTGKEGGSYLLDRLLEHNYTVAPVDLLGITDIPAKVDLVISLGPVNGFLDLEVAKLKRYLRRGGNLLITMSPNFQKRNWKNILGLLSESGVEVIDSIVLDRLATVQGSQATIPLVTKFNPSHTITNKFNERVLFPLVSVLKPVEVENTKFTWLARTSDFPASWGETNLSEVSTGKAVFDDKDIQGPITVAAVISNSAYYSKVGVLGSSSLVINGYQSQSPNFNFFMNMISWLMDDEGIISINRPNLTQQRIFLGSSQITLIFWVCIIFIPFGFFVLGIYFYRRKLQK
jgi:ABC-type uncharacterized transport system involved in gliding motility auxiliary subunit